METLTIELKVSQARKLIDDLADLGIIAIRTEQPAWTTIWNRLDSRLTQAEPDITDAEIMTEIKAYRNEKRDAESA